MEEEESPPSASSSAVFFYPCVTVRVSSVCFLCDRRVWFWFWFGLTSLLQPFSSSSSVRSQCGPAARKAAAARLEREGEGGGGGGRGRGSGTDAAEKERGGGGGAMRSGWRAVRRREILSPPLPVAPPSLSPPAVFRGLSTPPLSLLSSGVSQPLPLSSR